VKGEQYERFFYGIVGIHEGAEEILVVADFHCSAHVGHLDCADARFSGGPLYLYCVLEIAVILLTAFSR
jgi:hypothetical protein